MIHVSTYLGTVDELGQGDIRTVTEDMDVLPRLGGAVLEAEADEVTDIGGRAAAELDSKSRRVVGCQDRIRQSPRKEYKPIDTYGFQQGRDAPWRYRSGRRAR